MKLERFLFALLGLFLSSAPLALHWSLPVLALYGALVATPASAAGDDEGVDTGADKGRGEDSERGADVERDKDADWDREDKGGGDYDSRAGEGREFEPDVVLAIDLSDEARPRIRTMGFRVAGEEVLHGLGFRITQLSTPGGIPSDVALKRLRAADPTGIYDVNARYFASGDSACDGIRCDGQKMIGWPLQGCATSVRIGIVDTSVAASSPAIAGSQLQQQHFGDSGSSADGMEHGTEIATILVGNASAGFAGLLPAARLIVADVFDFSRNDRESTSALLVARGFDWLLAQKPSVINVAIAGPDNAVLRETVRRAVGNGIPVVAAAGNLGPQGAPRYPAAYPDAIAVTAVDRNKRIYPRANQGDYVTLAAPGVNIWSAAADGRGKFVDGTSFATPFVTAEVALMRAAEPQRTPAELRDDLRKRTLDLGAAGADRIFGAGLLQSRGCVATVSPSPH